MIKNKTEQDLRFEITQEEVQIKDSGNYWKITGHHTDEARACVEIV